MRPISKMFVAITAISLWVASSAAVSAQTTVFPVSSEYGAIIMHGRLGTPNYLQHMAQALGQAGIAVETPDMPWSRGRAFDSTVEASMAEIDAVVGRLHAKGAKRVFVVGHSLGGAAALRYGALHPEIGGLILMAASWNPGSGFWQRIVGESVARAEAAVRAGRGSDTDRYEYVSNDGKAKSVEAHATGFFDFNRVDSPMALSDNAKRFKGPLPVLWLSASGDSRTARAVAESAFDSLLAHPKSRYGTLDVNHVGIVKLAAPDIVAWLDSLR